MSPTISALPPEEIATLDAHTRAGWDVGCLTMALGEAATLTVRGDKVCTTFGASHNIGPTHKRPVSLCLSPGSYRRTARVASPPGASAPMLRSSLRSRFSRLRRRVVAALVRLVLAALVRSVCCRLQHKGLCHLVPIQAARAEAQASAGRDHIIAIVLGTSTKLPSSKSHLQQSEQTN